MKFELQNYLTLTGENPVESWFMSLDAQTAQRIHRSLDQLKQGNFIGCKPIADAKVKGVRERKSQKRDVSKALEYWKDYKARKGGK